MNNLLLAFAGALILAFAALFVGPHFVDWNTYRTVFEEQATRLAGRKVTVEGDVNLRLLPAPYVSFERVKIAGNTGAPDTPLLEVKNYTLWLAVPPLLQGEIEARSMEIDHPTVRLALTAEGGVSWAGLGRGDVDLPFVPRNVAFRDTNIRNGRIEIIGAQGDRLMTIADVSGTFSARALSGPFKFVGEIGSGEDLRSVRWSTGRFDESSGLRIKGTTRNDSTGLSYAVDGLLQKIMTRPVFTGGVAGKLRKKGRTGFEMKTDVYADTAGAQFRDVTLLLDAEGRPQIINGTGKADWQGNNGATVQLDLASRWLDIDRLIDNGKKSELVAQADTALEFLAHALPGDIATTATFKATQVNFGGDALDDLNVKLTRRGEETALEQLTANLPGATQLEMVGKIRRAKSPAERSTFAGTVDVKGRILSRFAAWLNPDWKDTVAKSDGRFAIRSSIEWSGDGIALDDVRGRLNAVRFAGQVRHQRQGIPQTNIALETPAFDASRFFPNVAAVGTASRNWNSLQATSAVGDSGADTATTWRLNIGQLNIGTAVFADVAMDLTSRGGRHDIKRAVFSSATGLELDASVDAVSDAKDGHPAPLRFVVRATTPAAYDELLDLTGGVVSDVTIDRGARALLPIHVAGSIIREAGEQALNLRYDGTFAGNPALGRVRIEGAQEDLKARNWTVTTDVSLDNPDVLLSQLGVTKQSLLDIQTDEPGRIVLYAIGRPEKGMKTDFSLQSGALTLGFSGAVESSANGLRLNGDISGAMPAKSGVASIFAVLPEAKEKATFTARMTRDAKNTVLKSVRIAAGETSLTGSAVIETSNTGTTAEVTVVSSRLSLPDLLSSLSQGAATASEEPKTSWAETQFDFAPFKGLSLIANIKAAELRLDEEMVMQNAEFVVSGSEDRMSIREFTAQAGAGRIVAEAIIERRPAGAQATVRMRGEELPVNVLSGSTDDATEGTTNDAENTIAFDLAATGLGLSPKGVVSVMEGQGRLRTTNVKLNRFSPQVIQDVVADIADEKATVASADLKSRLAQRLTDRPLELGNQDVAFKIRDGALQADKLRIDTPAASILATTFVDIARLRLDSEWRVAPKSGGGATALPPVTVFFAGDLRKLSKVEPGFGVAALERELTVRRLEGNIDQLEGLQSLGLKPRKPRDNQSSNEASTPNQIRPTIGGEVSEDIIEEQDGALLDEGGELRDVQPAPPRPSRPKRRNSRANDNIWQLQGEKPPVELRLQTPENANPT